MEINGQVKGSFNNNNQRNNTRNNTRNNRICFFGILLSAIAGLQLETIFYTVLEINFNYVPILMIILLWAINTILFSCLVDEFLKKVYRIRIYWIKIPLKF